MTEQTYSAMATKILQTVISDLAAADFAAQLMRDARGCLT